MPIEPRVGLVEGLHTLASLPAAGREDTPADHRQPIGDHRHTDEVPGIEALAQEGRPDRTVAGDACTASYASEIERRPATPTRRVTTVKGGSAPSARG